MSGAEGFSRRAVLAGAVAIGAGSARGASLSTDMGTLRVSPAQAPGVAAFLGIRYARAQRFCAPVPVVGVEQTADGQFGPACPQPGGRYQPQGEDCLFLNVWAPTSAAAAPRAVMV